LFVLHSTPPSTADRARQPLFTVFLSSRTLPRARCLTLTLAPDGAGPGRHLGLADVTLGVPLATRARVGRLITLERLCSNPPLRVARTPGARGSGINVSRYRGRLIELLVAALLALANLHCVPVRLFGFRGREASPRPRPQQYHAQAFSVGVPAPGVTEPTRFAQMASSLPRHCSACTAGRTRQLSVRSIRCREPLRRLRGRFRSFRRPQTAETGTDRGAPKNTEANGRDAPHVAQGKDLSHSREHGQLSLHCIS